MNPPDIGMLVMFGHFNIALPTGRSSWQPKKGNETTNGTNFWMDVE